VVGGGWGGRLSLDALVASSRYHPVAVADLRPAVREELAARYPGVAVFADHDSLLAAGLDLDVLCVSTFPPSHEEVTLDALGAGGLAGLLVEKPLGHTAGSGARILAAVRDAGLPLAVPHNMLTSATGRRLLAEVRDGAVGDVETVEIAHRGWDLVNAGIHWLQFALTLLAPRRVRRVLAATDRTTRTFRDGMQVETAMVTSLDLGDGVRVVLHTGDDTAVTPGHEVDYRIHGTAGRLTFHGWEPGFVRHAAATGPERVTPDPLPVTGHQAHLERLAAEIAAGTSDLTVADRSLDALEAIEAAYLSARLGCRVDLPLADFRPPPPVSWDPGTPYDGTGGGRDGRAL
jgi:predicted dehydrogenase